MPEPTYEEKLATMRSLALELGFSTSPMARWQAELGLSIATRLKNRDGQHIYQSVAYSIPGFPRDATLWMLPEELLVDQSLDRWETATLTWRLQTVQQLTSALHPILLQAKGHWTAGCSRALVKTDSELWSPEWSRRCCRRGKSRTW